MCKHPPPVGVGTLKSAKKRPVFDEIATDSHEINVDECVAIEGTPPSVVVFIAVGATYEGSNAS